MSTDYRFNEPVTVKKLLAAAKKLKLAQHKEHAKDEHFAITDGNTYMWFYAEDNLVHGIARYGNNYGAETDILVPLAAELQVGFVSEYDDEYYEDDEHDIDTSEQE